MARAKWHDRRFVRGFADEMQRRMNQVGALLEGEAKRGLSGPSPSGRGQPPGVMSGALRRSITHEVERRKQHIVARVGTNIEYARHLEFGSPAGGVTIKPVKAKALAIPIHPRTRTQTRVKGPREFRNLTLIWPKGAMTGRLVDAKGETWYLLVKRSNIFIEARPFLRPALDKNRAAIRRIIRQPFRIRG